MPTAAELVDLGRLGALGTENAVERRAYGWDFAGSCGRIHGVQVAVMTLMLVVLVANDPELNVEEWATQLGSDGLFLSISTIATTLPCVPLVEYLAGRRESESWAFLGLGSTGAKSVAIWVLALVAFVVVSDSITIASGRSVVPESMAEMYSSVNPVLLLLALAVAAPLFEEICFRGFLLSGLEASGVSAVVAAIVSSLAWSTIHLQFDLYGILTIFLIGLLLAAARAKTGSLLPCMAMHAVGNVIAFTEAAFLIGPTSTLGQIRRCASAVLPGATVGRHMYWRYSLLWQKPSGALAETGAPSPRA